MSSEEIKKKCKTCDGTKKQDCLNVRNYDDGSAIFCENGNLYSEGGDKNTYHDTTYLSKCPMCHGTTKIDCTGCTVSMSKYFKRPFISKK